MLTYEEVAKRFRYDETLACGLIGYARKPCNSVVSRVSLDGASVTHIRKVKIKDKTYNVKDIVWLLHNKEWPVRGLYFLDNDPLNCRIENLRVLPSAEELNQDNANELWEIGVNGILRWRISFGCWARKGQESGSANRINGYRFVGYGTKHYAEHRVVYLMQHGQWPNNQIDHKDGNRDNNTPDNLRDVNRTENAKNKRLSARNTSGHPGVRLYKANGKWRAQIKADGYNKSLGYFFTKEEAVAARKAAEQAYGYGPSHGKEPNAYAELRKKYR